MTVIAGILPPQAAVEETFTDAVLTDGGGTVLFPEEEAVLARAVDKRRREFTTGRACARAALARLGIAPVPILPGARGAPQWPSGVVGSITHCDGYRAAAVAWADDVTALGLDAEPNEPLPDGVLAVVTLPAERDRLAALAQELPARADAAVCWDRLLFCAKEAVYKAWYPLAGRWLGFEQADVTIDPATGRFTAQLLTDGPVDSFTGRWLARGGLLLTTVALLPSR